MQYLLMIYENEQLANDMSEAEKGKVYGDYMEFTKQIRASGHMKAGDALQPVATAKSVRIRSGKTTITDGPFAETKEQLGGYYLIEARDRQEAIQVAARIPGARLGSVEVRALAAHDPREPWPRHLERRA